MDIGYFFNILWRRRWLILSVTMIAAITAWFLVGKLPPVYKSSAVISTGIIQFKGRTLSPTNSFIQKYEIEGTFNQLMEDMKLPQVIKLLQDDLLAHEFQQIGMNTAPFRQPDYEKLGLSPEEVDAMAKATFINYDSTDLEQNKRRDRKRLLEALEYDYKSLTESLELARRGDTDYLELSFSSEKPELSYFALKNYLDDFLTYYENELNYESNEKVVFFKEITNEKKAILDSLLNEINIYKEANNIIDVETQSEAIISQIADLEKRKNEESTKLIPLRTSIRTLREKIFRYNNTYSEYLSNDRYTRQDFNDIDKKIKRTQAKLISAKGSSKDRYESELIRLRSERAGLVAQLVAKNANDNHPWHQQVQKWISDKLESEIELEYVEEAVDKYTREVDKLYGRLGGYQHDDEVLRGLEEAKEVAQEEYIDTKARLEEVAVTTESTPNPLNIVEPVEKPEKPEPSLRPIIAAFAGIAGGSMTSILIFLLAFFDTTVQSPSQFKSQIKLPFLGVLNRVKMPSLNLYYLFHTPDPKKGLASFRENIRKIRAKIEESGQQSFLFVSPKPEEGKSFLVILVAYALSLNNKRVLIIDTNFRNNTLSNFKDDPQWNLEGGHGVAFAPNKSLGSDQKMIGEGTTENKGQLHLKNIDIIGNKQSMQSPSEVLAGKDFKRIMESYKAKYDYIFFEAAAMNEFSDASELAPFADKVVGVFSSDAPIRNADDETIETLRRYEDKFLGGILNKVDLSNI